MYTRRRQRDPARNTQIDREFSGVYEDLNNLAGAVTKHVGKVIGLDGGTPDIDYSAGPFLDCGGAN